MTVLVGGRSEPNLLHAPHPLKSTAPRASGVQPRARDAKTDSDQSIRITDCRYVFQRPAEAARLQARRRYAVRRGHAPGERAAILPASPCAPGRQAAAATARCAMPVQRPSSACHKENSRMTQSNRASSRAAASSARPSRHD
ncbi:hypothetical protein DIE08_08055 [Burkholderia sp. Bp9004]|nr:hypothetical protein DIE08_08055 [Burkholderia sp. Bp9004]